MTKNSPFFVRQPAIVLAVIVMVWACLVALAGSVSAQSGKTPEYVGSGQCSACHQDEAAAWEGSHHALAWTHAQAENILGDFNNATFEQNGVVTRFFRDGETFMIESDGPDGKLTEYPVAGVIGIEPLQQYILETEKGKFQSFDVVWDTEKKEWYHLYPDQVLTADDGLHWTGPYKSWNARCAECHATDFDKNYSPLEQAYSSTQSEIGVGCEACHGPAQAHVEWAQDGAEPTSGKWYGVDGKGFVVDLMKGGETLVQQCAGCHSRREPFEAGNPLPGTPFHDAYRLSTLREGAYHADGQILDEVYVYGSFLQSKMYAEGVTCSNCHDAHSAELKAEGNGVCTQCHSPAGNTEFAALKPGLYDDPEHHFHEQGSDGAQCKNCHMMERNFMVVDGRRDHSFRIPRPELKSKTRAPNTCNDCHTDKTAKWAARAIEAWYPDSEHRGPHFSNVIAAARVGLQAQVPGLVGMAEYDKLPAIVRATALEMLAQAANPDLAKRLEPLLSHPDPIIRGHAIAVQRGAPETDRSQRIVGLLGDQVKSVRIAAARGFLGMRIAHMPKKMNQNLNRAMGDWQGSLRAKADFPETQLVLAGIGLTTRNMPAALGAFGDAVEMDPQLTQAWSMMVRIHDALGDRDKAVETLNRAIELNPDDVQLNLMKADMAQ